MTGRENIFLQIEGSVAESCDRFLGGLREGAGQFLITSDQANASSTASGTGLKHHRIADLIGQSDGLGQSRHCLGPGDNRKTGIVHQLF